MLALEAVLQHYVHRGALQLTTSDSFMEQALARGLRLVQYIAAPAPGP